MLEGEKMTDKKNLEQFLEAIQINTQSSVCISWKQKIYVDPFLIQEETKDADLIFITHAHDDHFSTESIEKIKNESTVLVVPESMRKHAEMLKWDAAQLVFVQPETRMDICGILTEVIPAYNLEKPFHPRSNQWVGYVLHLDGIRCYFTGDTDATRECAAVQCELAVVPVGGEFTMNVEEAAALVREMCPAIAIPVHYGSIVGDSEAGRRFAKGVESFTRVLLKLDE